MTENKIVTYTYDMAGIRDSKTANGITYHYDTLNGKVVRQTWTQNGKEKVFDIIYDAGGQPYACVYEGYRYYYVLNQQGDVIQIVGSGGTVCAEYRYDAWGNVLSITGLYAGTLGAVNPIRYRGYFYDTETGFYYLQSRYYDPSIGRFINADSFASTGQGFLGYNMFAYCGNNPVNCSDPTGHAAGRSYLAYDKGGGYFYLAPQPEQGSKYRSLLETFALDFYHRCGANPPARVIIACYKVDTPYIKKPADDLKDSLLFSAIGSFGTGKLGESLEKYIKKQLNKSISGYVGKSIGGVVGFTVPFILDSWIESAFGSDIPPGTYDLHAVTSFERYRQIDPATGQFFCWYDVVITTYYIDMQIGQTSQWVKVEWDN